MKKLNLFILAKIIGFYINSLSYVNKRKARKLAYRLFSQPRKGKLKENFLPKTLQFCTQEIFAYNNENFQTYIWPGDETIILLAHGWESNSSRWKKLLRYLKPLGNTIVAIDAPAHGLSDGTEFNAPKYADFIHTLSQKYNPTTIIGHSIGGAALAFYLNKYRNPKVEKVILLGAPSEFKILSDQFIHILSLNNRVKDLLEKYYFKKFNIDIHDFSGHKFAQHFTQKALIAHDTEDKIVSVAEGRKYASTWKDAIYIETKGLGHSMHDEDLYKQIVTFISEE